MECSKEYAPPQVHPRSGLGERGSGQLAWVGARRATSRERTYVHVAGKLASCKSPESDEISTESSCANSETYEEGISYKIASFSAEQNVRWASELLGNSTPVECSSLEMLIFWSQMWCQKKQYSPDTVNKLSTFQDTEADAPRSHEFVLSLAVKGPTLLGVRDWGCSEHCGQSVRLHIVCVAAGTSPHDAAANRVRHRIWHLPTKEFSASYLPGPVMDGRNLRDAKDAKPPSNLDNRSALHVALLNDKEKVIGAAVVYVHGPGFGYLPFFAIAKDHRGQGLGSKFAGVIIGVLRNLDVDAVVVEASVNMVTRDQKVVRFWERSMGFARATDEDFDMQLKLTNASRHSRVSGRAIRSMSGVFGFQDGCIMFRGTKPGWTLGHTAVALPMLSNNAAVCCSIGAVHEKMCQVDDSLTGFDDSGSHLNTSELSTGITVVGKQVTAVDQSVQTSLEGDKIGWTTTFSTALSASEGPTSETAKNDGISCDRAPSADVPTGMTDNECSDKSMEEYGDQADGWHDSTSSVAESKCATMARVHLHAPAQEKMEAIACTLESRQHTNAPLQVANVEISVPEASAIGKRCWICRVCSRFVRALTCGCSSAHHSEQQLGFCQK